MRMNTKNAIEVLVDALKQDDGYRLSWQCNIAMAFVDEWDRTVKNGEVSSNREQLKEIGNKAAISFLRNLCSDHTIEDARTNHILINKLDGSVQVAPNWLADGINKIFKQELVKNQIEE